MFPTTVPVLKSSHDPSTPLGMTLTEVARCFQRPCPCLSPATIPPLRGRRSCLRAEEETGRSGRDDKLGRERALRHD
jgi:hypothetical protein